ncbi:hypothetical protein SAMN05428984_1957 [Sphingomonas sp. OK281]|nr:hypothetical protein SAMN05428984_1957 [Sphingomonas sp. OK281]
MTPPQRATTPTGHHPGEGRGPVGKVAITKDRARLATFPNWTPASAGEMNPKRRLSGGFQ